MKAGLEVHQQLSTGKLFCACPSELSEVVIARVIRRLHATGGERGAIDAATRFQAGRGQSFEYEAASTSCLVELDEEPPLPIRAEAIDAALTLALLLGARPLDEIEVMRKIVVDGSNTAGFQRTALVAVDGAIEVGGKRISIPTICLEEDAGRKIGESSGRVTYRLDRLGIPLIEIATGPEIENGAEARAVAEELGLLLRVTGKVRRGIGTIREDLNVSTPRGTRIEIKGVQDLRKIGQFVEGEERRQRFLVDLAEELGRRGASVPDGAPVDLSETLRGAVEGPIGRTLERGGTVLGIALAGFGGLLGPREGSEERLGRELADHARAAGVGGILHSDELPAQGVDAALAAKIRTVVGAASDSTAFVVVAAPSSAIATAAITAVRARARQALEGVPAETRDPLPDGRTRYSRPLPGRDRMYPETDVPPVPVGAERLARIRANLPERPEVLRERLTKEFALSMDLARQLQRSGEAHRFFDLVGRGRSPGAVARLLTQELPAAIGEDAEHEAELSSVALDELLRAVERGDFAKEGVTVVLRELVRGAPTLAEAQRRSGLSGIPPEELATLARELVEKNRPLIAARGKEAFQPLMGDLMRAVRGRCDGQRVAQALRTALAANAPSPGT